MVKRVSSYFPKGGHSASTNETDSENMTRLYRFEGARLRKNIAKAIISYEHAKSNRIYYYLILDA